MPAPIAPAVPAASSAPSLPPYAPALTGLRGLAALWVFAFHLWQFSGGLRLQLGPLDLTPLAAHGHLGVDLFFVLSGYLIGGPWVLARLGGTRLALRPFWKRRCLRVLPAYWAQWLVLAALALAASRPFPMSAGESALSLLLGHNLIRNDAPLNPVWWSLPVEWDFYLIAPWLALLFARPGRLPAWLLPLILASVAWRVLSWWVVHHYLAEGFWLYRWIIQLPGRLDQFLLGMLTAWALALGRDGSPRWLFWAGSAATLVSTWLLYRVGNTVDRALAPWIFFQFTLFGCAFAALIGAAAMPGRHVAARLLGNRVLVWFGTISYSLYLWHYPALQWLQGWARGRAWDTASLTWIIAVLLLALVLAQLSYWLFERPFLPSRRRLRGTDVMTAAAPS